MMMPAKVTKWISDRGFGFLQTDDEQTAFCHVSVLRRCGFESDSLDIGDRVMVEITQDDTGRARVERIAWAA